MVDGESIIIRKMTVEMKTVGEGWVFLPFSVDIISLSPAGTSFVGFLLVLSLPSIIQNHEGLC